jgi:hypothetical protein
MSSSGGTVPPEHSGRQRYLVIVSAVLASFIGYFDLLISGLASSLAWPTVFFPASNPTIAIAVSIGAYALSLVVRPLGAFVFGHFGDRLGRKSTLITTLVFIGIGVGGIAILPPYASIGITAPILLIVLRLILGFGLGGDYGSAISWVAEIIPKSKWRVLCTGLIQSMVYLGTAVASLSFTLTAWLLPSAAFVSYGWRIIFGIGTVVLVLGGLMRWFTVESSFFKELQAKRALDRRPSVSIFKDWKTMLALTGMALPIANSVSLVISPYSLSYLAALKVSPALSSGYVALAYIVGFVAATTYGIASSMVGRKKPFLIFQFAATTLYVYPFFLLLNTTSHFAIAAAYVIWALITTAGAAIMPDMLAVNFITKYRASGVGMPNQLGSMLGGLVIAFIIPAILASQGVLGSAPYIALISAMFSVIGLISLVYVKDRRELPV